MYIYIYICSLLLPLSSFTSFRGSTPHYSFVCFCSLCLSSFSFYVFFLVLHGNEVDLSLLRMCYTKSTMMCDSSDGSRQPKILKGRPLSLPPQYDKQKRQRIYPSTAGQQIFHQHEQQQQQPQQQQQQQQHLLNRWAYEFQSPYALD